MTGIQEPIMRDQRFLARFVRAIVDSIECILMLSILCVPIWVSRTDGQDLQARKSESMSISTRTLPSAIQSQVQALGNRLRITGREETVLDAQLVDDVGRRKTIRVIHQFSGMVRIEGLHEKSAVTFDGEFTHGVSDRMDDALMDTFVLDTAEGMFYSLQNGASMVLLGHNTGAASQAGSDVNQPRYDIYAVTTPDRIRRTKSLQSRRFYFDSATGLLASTRYSDSAGVNIETRFLKWEYVDGSAYPRLIERYENGRLTFSIAATRLSGQSPRNATSFQTGVDSRE